MHRSNRQEVLRYMAQFADFCSTTDEKSASSVLDRIRNVCGYGAYHDIKHIFQTSRVGKDEVEFATDAETSCV